MTVTGEQLALTWAMTCVGSFIVNQILYGFSRWSLERTIGNCGNYAGAFILLYVLLQLDFFK